VTIDGDSETARPAEIALLFSDGGRTPAELIRTDGPSLVLEVSGYTTAAGTGISPKRWAIADWSRVPGGILLRIGDLLR
jgi:hypothetical protein